MLSPNHERLANHWIFGLCPWWVFCNKTTEQPLYFKTRFNILQRNYSYGRKDLEGNWKIEPNNSSELIRTTTTLQNGWQLFEGNIQVESTVHLNLNHPLEEDDDSFLLPAFTTPLFILATTAVFVVMKGLKRKFQPYSIQKNA